MLSSLLFVICVGLNCWLIWRCLSRPLRTAISELGVGLLRTRRYFSRPLTEIREQALRRRTGMLLRHLGVVILILVGIVVLYSPSMVFAHYRAGVATAFYSLEALIGMLVAAVFIGWRGRES